MIEIKKDTQYEIKLSNNENLIVSEDEAVELRDELTRLLVDTNR